MSKKGFMRSGSSIFFAPDDGVVLHAATDTSADAANIIRNRRLILLIFYNPRLKATFYFVRRNYSSCREFTALRYKKVAFQTPLRKIGQRQRPNVPGSGRMFDKKKKTQDLAKNIKVVIVDDSSTYRQLLRDVLSADERIEVVSHAVNGKLALPRIRYYKPDFVILDQEMPEMTGLETLDAIRRDYPEVGVIMFSSHTTEGARVTINALQKGALDFLTKPDENTGDITQYIRRELIHKIKELADRKARLPAPERTATEQHVHPPEQRHVRTAPGSYSVCGIGISTGGPSALRELLPRFPAKLNGTLLIVQHMPPRFTALLAENLNEVSALRVSEAEDGMSLEAGRAYIAPGGMHMCVRQTNDRVVVQILDTPPESNCKPSVNVLFRGLAEVYGSKAIGVVMTGMGNDGFSGMQAMNEKNAYLLAQSEKSCLVYGMPALPVKHGLVQESLDIPALAERIKFLMGVRGH